MRLAVTASGRPIGTSRPRVGRVGGDRDQGKRLGCLNVRRPGRTFLRCVRIETLDHESFFFEPSHHPWIASEGCGNAEGEPVAGQRRDDSSVAIPPAFPTLLNDVRTGRRTYSAGPTRRWTRYDAAVSVLRGVSSAGIVFRTIRTALDLAKGFWLAGARLVRRKSCDWGNTGHPCKELRFCVVGDHQGFQAT